MLVCENNSKITMDEFDYGLSLPFKISGNVEPNDKFIFIIKKTLHSKKEIIKKEYSDCKEEDGKLCFDLCFTAEESNLLEVGKYVYVIKQCRECELHNTLEHNGEFEVRKGCAV